jgi:Hemerythrin HHE cation binding domain
MGSDVIFPAGELEHPGESGCKALWDECLAPYLRRRRLEEQPISKRTLEDVACLVQRGSFQTAAKRLGEVRHAEERAMALEEKTLFPILERLEEPSEALVQAKADHQIIRGLLDALTRSLSVHAIPDCIDTHRELMVKCSEHWQHEQELLGKHINLANEGTLEEIQTAVSHC